MYKFSLYYHTLRNLKLHQIVNRIQRRFKRIKTPTLPSSILPRLPIHALVTPIVKYLPLWQGNIFSFHHYSATITADTWHDQSHNKLWLYHLHYFDECNEQLILRWISENPQKSLGWEPYPLSLRIVNWIKWLLQNNNRNPLILKSLYQQVAILQQTIEYHLLGNHLLANAKALLFAGCFFQGPQGNHWLKIASKLLSNQLQEQILADGAHFELSPMYHAIILEDLIDMINVLNVYDISLDISFKEYAGRMLAWLAVVTHPDGDISFFNDSCLKQSATPKQLHDYAAKFNIASILSPSQQSGVIRLEKNNFVVIADCAAVGASYIPGHAHADTLSFELSKNNERIFVNSGISTYAVSELRHFQRSTKAHNTVEIAGKNSSQIWASFRVGKAAKAQIIQFQSDADRLQLSAWHDGYLHIKEHVKHTRTWTLTDILCISDVIQCKLPCEVNVYFHLHPNITILSQTNSSIHLLTQLNHKIMLSVDNTDQLSILDTKYFPEFGLSIDNKTIVINAHCVNHVVINTVIKDG